MSALKSPWLAMARAATKSKSDHLALHWFAKSLIWHDILSEDAYGAKPRIPHDEKPWLEWGERKLLVRAAVAEPKGQVTWQVQIPAVGSDWSTDRHFLGPSATVPDSWSMHGVQGLLLVAFGQGLQVDIGFFGRRLAWLSELSPMCRDAYTTQLGGPGPWAERVRAWGEFKAKLPASEFVRPVTENLGDSKTTG